MTRVVIHGAAGRMGRRLVALAIEDPKLELVGAMEHAEHDLIGTDAGELAGTGRADVPVDATLPACDVVIDFSLPAGTRALLPRCREAGCGLVIGTTGLSDDRDQPAIDAAAADIPILQAPNMSLGVNLLFSLAGRVAKQLGDDYDIEIVETHHRFKRDAPSGTAMGLAKAVCESTGKTIADDLVMDRHGDDVPRRPGQIGMHALRSGDVVGRHTVSFGALGEEVTLGHVATSRDVFVRGALRGAKWLAGRKPGRYHMRDVLGLEA